MEDAGGQTGTDKGLRALSILGVLVLAFASAVMIVTMVDIGGTPTCHDLATTGGTGDCFSGSSTQKAISLVLGWPSGVLAGVAGFLLLLYAITGRRGRLTLVTMALALILGGLSILVGSV